MTKSRVAVLVVGLALLGGGPAVARQAEVIRASLATAGAMPKIRLRVLPPVAAPLKPGAVDIEIVVGLDGRVAHARLAKSGPARSIDAACLAAIHEWRFDPAMEDGYPTATLVLVRFTYAPPAAGGGQADVTGQLVPVLQEPPPLPDRLGELPVHTTKESGIGWPMPIRSITARYTPDAMRARVQGRVDLEVVVLADGTVGAARVVKTLDPSLDRAALITARYWFFAPATIGGVAVPAKVPMSLEFRLH
jgi:TonB family protein